VDAKSYGGRWSMRWSNSIPHHDEESGHVRGRGGRRGDDRAVISRKAELRIQSANHAVALVHGAVRELRGSHGEGRGKAQADTLRKARSETEAKRLLPDGP